MAPAPLDAAARAALAHTLPAWRVEGDALMRAFRFDDFSAAFAFMTRVALAAERADHHPDWHNVYNVVEIRLSTHDAGTLTARDVALATTIDGLAAASGVRG